MKDNDYRLLQHKDGKLSIHEVYYGEYGPTSYQAEPAKLIGGSLEDIRSLLEMLSFSLESAARAMEVERGGADPDFDVLDADTLEPLNFVDDKVRDCPLTAFEDRVQEAQKKLNEK